MGANSKIEWTDATWNPTSGCTRCSEGCRNCYAFELHDMRHEAFKAGKSLPIQYAKPFNELQLFEDRLGEPLKWQKPKRVFVDSMSDLFHEDVPDSFIRKAFGVMSTAGQHTFQVLTKRADRMAAWFADPDHSLTNCQAELVLSDWWEGAIRTATGRSRCRDLGAINGAHGEKVGDGNHWPLPNVWLGVSVESQAMADKRIPELLKIPAAVRFLSCEPLLGPVDLSDFLANVAQGGFSGRLRPGTRDPAWPSAIRWVISGGESGPNARPTHPDWFRSLRDQCLDAGVSYFHKQNGEWLPSSDSSHPRDYGTMGRHKYSDRFGSWNGDRFEIGTAKHPVGMLRVGKKAAGRLLDGREWNEFPTSNVKV